MAKIEVASCSIEELFSEYIDENINGVLEIPEYQRPYVWSKKEIDRLLSDIEEHNDRQDDKPMYYLGSIILHKHGNKLSIIDGQQRITTLAIIQYKKDTNKIPQIKYVSPTTKNNIKENYNYLQGKNLDFISFDNLNVTLVVTDKEDDAYTFFETQNTGGVRLTGIDIIKAHHLRAITSNGKKDEQYAVIWESQRNIEKVVGLLIKARRWNFLAWEGVPAEKNIKETKNSIIKDFSEKTLEKSKAAYSNIILSGDYSSFKISPYKFAVRQPLASGENFIDYLKQFTGLYQRMFRNNSDADIPDEFYKFQKTVINNGSGLLKEFYEISMLCYVQKFGTCNLQEASYWIFRYTFSLRFSNARYVKEKSIPAFIRNNTRPYLFDIIFSSFNSSELIEGLKQFTYIFNAEMTDKDHYAKPRFIEYVKKYFDSVEFDIKHYDECLKKGIENKLNEVKNGK